MWIPCARERVSAEETRRLKVGKKLCLEPVTSLRGHPSPPHGVSHSAQELERGRGFAASSQLGARKARGAAGPGWGTKLGS